MEKKYEHLVINNKNIPLSAVAFHNDVACIERYFAEGFPLHLAIHKVSNAENVEKYTDSHVHDVDELNIIIPGDEGMEYLIQLGDEEYNIKTNTSILIPKGLAHAANIVKGSGYYIAVRLDNI
ncbi:hypothetical protein [Clostridium saccharoperbutylacetonicum]